ncbi:MAG TPA: hypothetical protein VHE10_03105 [Candidatus Paceibacterota bacterium]|nr:hypothetical protein [Candidatus Paceibacterota bacterium]
MYYSSLKPVYLTLRDLPEGVEQPIQTSYLNMLMGMFLRILVKIYSPDDLVEEDRAKLRKYLERIFEAKDALMGKDTGNGRDY